MICLAASSTVAVDAVHAEPYCSGAPPVLEVETQLNVLGHLRRRPFASKPVGSLSGMVAASESAGAELSESAESDESAEARTPRREEASGEEVEARERRASSPERRASSPRASSAASRADAARTGSGRAREDAC